jgi:hypothetical protein
MDGWMDGQTDRQTCTTKLTGLSAIYANAPKTWYIYLSVYTYNVPAFIAQFSSVSFHLILGLSIFFLRYYKLSYCPCIRHHGVVETPFTRNLISPVEKIYL